MKMTVFWVVTPCRLVCLPIALMMEAVSTSEMSVNFYQTRRNNPEDSHLQDTLCSFLGCHMCRLVGTGHHILSNYRILRTHSEHGCAGK
jgi:hypothetical protein